MGDEDRVTKGAVNEMLLSLLRPISGTIGDSLYNEGIQRAREAINQLPAIEDRRRSVKEIEAEFKRHFEEKVLESTCFNSFDDLMKDRTLVQINAPRALIAVELKGVWRGMKIAAKLFAEQKGEGDEQD